MRQRRWMEYSEDYNFTLHYHPSIENVVADALSRKSRGVLASVASREGQKLETVGKFRSQYSDQAQGALGSSVATSSLLSRVLSPRGRMQRYRPSRTGYGQARVTKAGPST